MYLSYYALAQFLAVAIYLNIAIVVLRKNSRERLNQVFFLLMLSLILWGVTGMARLMVVPVKTAIHLTQLGSLGWLVFPSLFVWFVLVFIKSGALQKTVTYFYLFLPSVCLVAIEYFRPFRLPAENDTYIWVNSFGTYLFVAYLLIFFLFALYCLARYHKRMEIKLYRQQAALLFISTLVSLCLGIIIEFFPFPSQFVLILGTGNTYLSFWVVGMFLAVVRYKLFDLNFTLAGQNIVDNMTENLLLLDRNGRIVDVNKRTAKALQLTSHDIKRQDLSTFFDSSTLAAIGQMIANKHDLAGVDTSIKRADGELLPVLFSCSCVREGEDVFGWVCIASDIAQRKKDESAIKTKNTELQAKLDELETVQKAIIARELAMVEMKKEIHALEAAIATTAAGNKIL